MFHLVKINIAAHITSHIEVLFQKRTRHLQLQGMEDKLEHDPEYQLPEPQTFMTAKTYKAKFAEPLIKKLKKMIKSLIVQCAKNRGKGGQIWQVTPL